MIEPLLSESQRHALYPIEHQDIWDHYKYQLASFWTATEIDFSKDWDDWVKLTSEEQKFIKCILAFFAGADTIVGMNIMDNFTKQVTVLEAQTTYIYQAAVESIHCVAPETHVLTDTGYHQIQYLAELPIRVWNGVEFSDTVVKKTGDYEKLLKVNLSNGMYLECTSGHKWFIRVGEKNDANDCGIITTELKPGDVISSYDFPVITAPDPDEFANPYTHGVFCGDGSYSQDLQPVIRLFDDKKGILPYLSISSMASNENANTTSCYITGKINKPLFAVPTNHSIHTKLKWLEGYMDVAGTIAKSAKGYTSVKLTSFENEFLQNVQLMLSTLGVQSNINFYRQNGYNSAIDDLSERFYEDTWVMYITSTAIHHLRRLGFSPKIIKLHTDPDTRQNARAIQVLSVVDEGRFSPTYCFNEPNRNSGVFNGILTGQSEVYSIMIDTYVKESQEKIRLLQEVRSMPSVFEKINWGIKWSAPDAPFQRRLIAFAIMEGLFFSSAFCAIYWLKQRNILPGLTKSNEFIARDEGMHTDFACLLYSKIEERVSEEDVRNMFKEAVEIEKTFIIDAIPCSMIGMNSKLMIQYIEYVADRLLVQLSYPKIFKSKNPFRFMELIGMECRNNFFETVGTQYQKAGVLNQSHKITTVDDF
jgi:ribonucleotide reductase beta subunit family protein with ferritin-like domain